MDDRISLRASAREGAGARWRLWLQAWHVPSPIRAQASVDPEYHPAWLYEHRLEQVQESDTPSRRRALEALPDRGSVLDVGAGAGAASLPLTSRAGRILAVDDNPELLRSFARKAADLGVEHALVQGVWPAVAESMPDADVVVCHNVLYSILELGPFVAAMAARARRRVVIEASDDHPFGYFRELWQRIHRIRRPDGPTADDAVAVIRQDLDIPVSVERWRRPSFWQGIPHERIVEIARIRLCLPPERDDEIRGLLNFDHMTAPQPAVTMWWDRG